MLTIEERVRFFDGRPDRVIVHVLSPQRQHEPGTFAPIWCSTTDGIVFPGHTSRTAEVTCPDCKAKLSDRVRH